MSDDYLVNEVARLTSDLNEERRKVETLVAALQVATDAAKAICESWTKVPGTFGTYYKCPNCGRLSEDPTNYCSFCGRDLRRLTSVTLIEVDEE